MLVFSREVGNRRVASYWSFGKGSKKGWQKTYNTDLGGLIIAH